MLNVLAIVVALGQAAGSASAFEKLEGYFIAEQVCEAYQSKNKRTNPGEMTTAPLNRLCHERSESSSW